MKYYDISPTISEKTAVFPGDVVFNRNQSMSFQKGNQLTLSSIQSTLHIGAHADASNHYHAKGKGIEGRSLEPYLGKCQVIRVSINPGERIYPKDVSNIEIQAERLLFCTNSFPDPDQWNSDFNSFSPELIHFLAQKKVQLVGIDTPSVDPEDSKKLESHQAIFETNMCILEGLILNEVPQGLYTLIALPLKIKDADASPVRAILVAEF